MSCAQRGEGKRGGSARPQEPWSLPTPSRPQGETHTWERIGKRVLGQHPLVTHRTPFPTNPVCWRFRAWQIVGPASACAALGPPRYQPTFAYATLGWFRLPAELLCCSLGVDFQMRGLEDFQTCLRLSNLGSAPGKLPPLTQSWPAFNVLPPLKRSWDTGSSSGRVGNFDLRLSTYSVS